MTNIQPEHKMTLKLSAAGEYSSNVAMREDRKFTVPAGPFDVQAGFCVAKVNILVDRFAAIWGLKPVFVNHLLLEDK
jgi:hypothetical protein